MKLFKLKTNDEYVKTLKPVKDLDGTESWVLLKTPLEEEAGLFVEEFAIKHQETYKEDNIELIYVKEMIDYVFNR